MITAFQETIAYGPILTSRSQMMRADVISANSPMVTHPASPTSRMAPSQSDAPRPIARPTASRLRNFVNA